MNRTTIGTIVMVCVMIGSGNDSTMGQVGQYQLPLERDSYVSDASFWLATFEPSATEYTPGQMAAAAEAFLETLDATQRNRLMKALDSPERREWTNLPSFNQPQGLRLGDLNQTQVEKACQLLATLLSPQGYRKLRDIMLADDQLLNRGRPRDGFAAECFYLVLFGKPSASDPWALQLDGHHIGVNVAISGDDFSLSPSFIGTQPQTYRLGNQDMRPLTGEIDDAYRFVNQLNDEQRKLAVVSRQKRQIVTGPGHDGQIPENSGLPCGQLDDSQKETLLRLIDRWVGDLPPQHATRRRAEIQAELDQMHFSWNGETEVGSPISYRIQCPSLIVEYACQDMGGDSQQHLHTMYRNPKQEYGGQLDR